MNPKKTALYGLAGMTMLLGSPVRATAATKASLQCRGAIARGVAQIAKVGLAEMTACHKVRDKGKTDRDCNVLRPTDVSTNLGRLVNRLTAVIGAKCRAGDPVLDNFPEREPVRTLFPLVVAVLEEGNRAFMGAPVFVADPQSVKSLARCHTAIGVGRGQVVSAALKGTLKCQKTIDKRTDTPAAIDASCVPTGSSAAGRATGKIGKSCGSLSGLQVGSCSDLPGCAIDGAVEMAAELARFAFGGPRTCGNGIVELGEVCDDGNADDTGACTAACQEARCGDGFVQAGVEECDDANTNPNDGCDRCAVPVIPPARCGTQGVAATLAVPYDAVRLSARVAAGRFAVAYPDMLGIPGNGLTTEQSRVVDLTGVAAMVANDQDGTLHLTVASADGFQPGGLARIVFDCPPGTELRTADFGCSTSEPSDQLGNALSPADVPCLVSALEPLGGAATTTTTTVTIPPTTTTTQPPANCGNLTVDPGETCDDGNTSNNDTCPSDCVVDPCTPISPSGRTVQLDFSAPSSIASVTVLLDYPEGAVSIPGSGGSVPGGIVTNPPAGATLSVNDLDHAVRIVAASGFNFGASGQLVRIHFENCADAAPPPPAAFSCTVLGAEDVIANPVDGVTCSVVLL